MKELSVIIPAYNEEKVIFNTVKEVEKTLDDSGLDYEIIVIDNGSSDNTFAEAMKATENNGRVKVIKEMEMGKGSALKAGIKFSLGRLVTMIDADLDLHPRQIPLFMEYMEKYNADVVVGSKRHPLSKLDYPLYRRFLSQMYQIFTKILFNLDLRDTQTGLKLFKYDVLNEVLPRLLCKKYAFDLELLVNINHRGFKIVEAPVEINWQRMENRVRMKDIWRIALDTAAIFYRLRILKYYNGVKK